MRKEFTGSRNQGVEKKHGGYLQFLEIWDTVGFPGMKGKLRSFYWIAFWKHGPQKLEKLERLRQLIPGWQASEVISFYPKSVDEAGEGRKGRRRVGEACAGKGPFLYFPISGIRR